MDKTKLRSPQSKSALPWPTKLPEWATLLMLLVLAFVIRGTVLWNTAVPARDGLAYIHYAFRLEREPVPQVLRESYHHPGYPFSILAVSWPIRAWTDLTGSRMTQLSAQLASSLAGWLLVIPMFYLGKRIYNVHVGFWGALLFQCLPSSGPALSDAISEPLFLLFVCSGLLFACESIQKFSLWCFGLCGLFVGLAYLVRPEGLVVLVACGLVLVARQCLPSTRTTWRRFVVGTTALVAPCVCVAAPYAWTIGGITNKPSVRQMTNTTQTAQADEKTPDGHLPLFAVHIRTDTSPGKRILNAIKAFALEFAHGYQYFGWIFVLLGVGWYSHRLGKVPGAWVLVVLMALQTTLVFWLLMKIGYVSQRHILILVICTVFQAVAVMLALPGRLLAWIHSKENSRTQKEANVFSMLLPTYSYLGVALVVLSMVLGLTRTLRPLHANCRGHYFAGKWLAAHTTSTDIVLDDHGWARFYAERKFIRGYVHQLPPECQGNAWCSTQQPHSSDQSVQQVGLRHFVVYNRASSRRRTSHYATYDEPTLLRRDAKAVFSWPTDLDIENAEVVIYQLAR
ncbi:MAG: ArnT family glycosyltransferase [Gemmataceae bacterium]